MREQTVYEREKSIMIAALVQRLGGTVRLTEKELFDAGSMALVEVRFPPWVVLETDNKNGGLL